MNKNPIQKLGAEFRDRHEARGPFTTAHLDGLLEVLKHENIYTAFVAALEAGYVLGYRTAERETKSATKDSAALTE